MVMILAGEAERETTTFNKVTLPNYFESTKTTHIQRKIDVNDHNASQHSDHSQSTLARRIHFNRETNQSVHREQNRLAFNRLIEWFDILNLFWDNFAKIWLFSKIIKSVLVWACEELSQKRLECQISRLTVGNQAIFCSVYVISVYALNVSALHQYLKQQQQRKNEWTFMVCWQFTLGIFN